MFIIVYRATWSIIIRMGYGEKVYRDYGQEMVETNKERGTLVTPTGTKLWMVNVFPICKLHLGQYLIPCSLVF
jgi:hypothetical protein